ncbi:hypothetical protein PWT90_00364 [Aphanocladium album]|nr:hypothetical protein PWT90_00364 [Aphanocladium album]
MAAVAAVSADADAAAAAALRPLSSSSISIHDLPNELLAAVFSHLASPSSLEPLFRDDASTILDTYYAARGRRPSRRHPLKSASLVSRRWRAAVLPYLFRHVLWTFRRLEEPPAEAYAQEGGGGGAGLHAAAAWFDVLAFLQRNRLGGAVESLMLHVPCPEHLIDDPTELVGRYGLVPSSISSAAGSTTTTGRGGDGCEDEDAESIVLSETASLVVAEVNGHATWANTWFWDLLFSVVDPLRISFLAAPVVLATMFSRKVFTRCQPLMMTRYHLISVSRRDRDSSSPTPQESDNDLDDDDDDDPSPTTHPAPLCDNLPCELFAHRRWTSLLANEGSSVSIYKSDAYGEIPPSPLLSLLGSGDPATRRFFRRSLRSLAYVAVMPMATHIQTTLAASALVPRRLEELFVQVMPRGVYLHDEEHRGGGSSFEGLELEDLLMERDAVYGLLFESIFIPGPQKEWEPLRVFETGDADDVVAWSEAVETVRASSSWWDVESQGRFVRNLARETGRRRRRRSAEGPAQVFSTPF